MERNIAIVDIGKNGKELLVEDATFWSRERVQAFCDKCGYKLVSFVEAEQKGAAQ